MKKYMLIIKDDEGNQFASFYDDYEKMEGARMDMQVSMGWYVEVYERIETEFGGEYQLSYIV